MMPNQDQVVAVLRIIIPMACAWLAAKGISVLGNSEVVADIGTVAIGIVAVVYALKAHTDAAKIASAAAVDPQVQIQVPRSLMIDNKKIAGLVHDDAVPNVTRLDEGQAKKRS